VNFSGQHVATPQHESLPADQRRRYQTGNEAMRGHRPPDLVLETEAAVINYWFIPIDSLHVEPA